VLNANPGGTLRVPPGSHPGLIRRGKPEPRTPNPTLNPPTLSHLVRPHGAPVALSFSFSLALSLSFSLSLSVGGPVALFSTILKSPKAELSTLIRRRT
jgi:hypothetical protein